MESGCGASPVTGETPIPEDLKSWAYENGGSSDPDGQTKALAAKPCLEEVEGELPLRGTLAGTDDRAVASASSGKTKACRGCLVRSRIWFPKSNQRVRRSLL